jgi:hypothetical protein
LPFSLETGSVLIVAEVTEKLDSLDDGKVMLEENHTTAGKVYMKSEYLVSNEGVVEEVAMRQSTMVDPALPGQTLRATVECPELHN